MEMRRLQRKYFIILIGQRELSKAEVKMDFLHMSLEALVIHEPEAEGKLRKLFMQLPHRRAQERIARGTYTYTNHAGNRLPLFGEIFFHAMDVGQYELGPMVQFFPCWGELKTSARSMYERDSQLFLQLLNAKRKRWLGDMQRSRRLAERAKLYQSAEVFQPFEIHASLRLIIIAR